MLPGEAIRGTSSFEWLDGRQFVIWRSHYDHREIPDGISVIGVTDGQLSMHYFDSRGVYRVYTASLDETTWRFWRDAPPRDLSQRFTGTFSDDGSKISGHGKLSKGGTTGCEPAAVRPRWRRSRGTHPTSPRTPSRRATGSARSGRASVREGRCRTPPQER
jgi:hypothetical protein